MLLDRDREVRPALDGGVVRDDDTLLSLDDADAGDDPGSRRLAVVQVPGGERAELEELAAGIDEPIDPLPRGHLAARAVPLYRFVAAARRDVRRTRTELRNQGCHSLVAGTKQLGVALDLRRQNGHRVSLAGRPDRKVLTCWDRARPRQ